MDRENNTDTFFALTASATGEPSKLYTPIVIMNIDRVIAAEAHAMWDTGAEVCVISKKLADALQLDVAPGPSAYGLTGVADASACYAYVSFVAGGGIVTVKCAVVDGHVGGVDYSIILGLNLIRRGTLAITGGNAGITLSFKMPATDVIDFTADAGTMPVSVMTLSGGRENLKLYTGRDAVKIMNSAIPDCKKSLLQDRADELR